MGQQMRGKRKAANILLTRILSMPLKQSTQRKKDEKRSERRKHCA